MPSDFLIAYRAMPFFQQLINRQECTIIQQRLSTIFLQISSANILPVATLFSTSLITFPNSAYFNYSAYQITIRDYSKYSEQRFLQDLSQLHWKSLLSGRDVDKLFSTFYNKLNKLLSITSQQYGAHHGFRIFAVVSH